MKALLQYDFKTNIKSAKFLIPILIFLLYKAFTIFEVSLCSTKYPMKIVFFHYIITNANLIYLIMVCISFIYNDTQDLLTEQIVFLKLQKSRIFWISKIIFLWIVGIVLSITVIIFPLIIKLFTDKFVILNGQSFYDLILYLIMLMIIALMGVLHGMIIQTKIVGHRTKAILFIIMTALMAVVKVPIEREFHVTKLFMWVLPPIHNMSSSLINFDVISFRVILLPMLYSIIYIATITAIYINIMKRKLF